MLRLTQTPSNDDTVMGSLFPKEIVPAGPALRFKARRRRSRVTIPLRGV